MSDDEPSTNSPEDIGYRRPPPARRETMTTTAKEEPKDEGARSFGVFLQQVDDGDLHDELAAKLREVVSAVTEYSDRYQREGKATLTLVLNVKALGNGSIAVAGDVKTKLPVAKRPGSLFWPTKGNNLTLENPRQQKLPLREVSQPKSETRDVNADRPVRQL